MDPRVRASRTQEKRVAKDLGGRVTPGSGNGWAVKNDVRNDTWSIECKTTTTKGFRLTGAALQLAERQAILDGREMAFITEIEGRMWVTISYAAFLEHMKQTKEE
jgi:hypothetical protein